MIAFVSGTVVEKKPTEVIIDVQGIGYRLQIPTSTFDRLPETGRPTRMLTHHYVREDAILLFGFATAGEREIFEVMLGVSGVGPRLALAALSAMSPSELRRHVVSGDAAMLTSIPGVGRKTAERLIVELRDRLADVQPADTDAVAYGSESAERHAARADALAALESLGFTRAAAEKSIRKVMRDHPSADAAEDLIRLALRE